MHLNTPTPAALSKPCACSPKAFLRHLRATARHAVPGDSMLVQRERSAAADNTADPYRRALYRGIDERNAQGTEDFHAWNSLRTCRRRC